MSIISGVAIPLVVKYFYYDTTDRYDDDGYKRSSIIQLYKQDMTDANIIEAIYKQCPDLSKDKHPIRIIKIKKL